MRSMFYTRGVSSVSPVSSSLRSTRLKSTVPQLHPCIAQHSCALFILVSMISRVRVLRQAMSRVPSVPIPPAFHSAIMFLLLPIAVAMIPKFQICSFPSCSLAVLALGRSEATWHNASSSTHSPRPSHPPIVLYVRSYLVLLCL